MENLTKTITLANVQGTQEQIKDYVNNYVKDINVHVTNLIISGTTVSFTTYSKITYEDLVVKLIRKKYPVNEEFAILRKAINGITDEYYIYNSYVEDCKDRAKAFIEERKQEVIQDETD